MGCWGLGPFQNDESVEWLGRAVQSPMAKMIERALREVLKRKTVKPSLSIQPPHPTKLQGIAL